MNKSDYLKTKIFYGLKNLNNGFDAENIYYFSETDFEIVLKRVQEKGIAIYGIEPWLNGTFYDVISYEQYSTEPDDPKWYKRAFTRFRRKKKNLMYSATYVVPNELLSN